MISCEVLPFHDGFSDAARNIFGNDFSGSVWFRWFDGGRAGGGAVGNG
jgi:hypothetical protein